jgi:DNA polymerase-3 subunit alpha
MKNRSFKIAGIVTSSVSKFDKTGAPYGRFVIEDFTGSREFMLFKKKYIEFKNFIDTPGNLLFITCNYQANKWKDGEYEVEITSMELLTEIRNKLTKELYITAQVTSITPQDVELIDYIMKKYTGEKFIKMNLLDTNQQLVVSTNCKSARVNPSNEFINELESINGVSVSFIRTDLNLLIDDKLDEILSNSIDEEDTEAEMTFDIIEEESE